ncbi:MULTISPECIES: CMD domain protein [unclassified Microbacterium]|uniref:CMD domain protein n=1 Tax=unclassified Microbacterium TaxID=2609290 RepID=UPI00214C72C1|nr:MULTISPECIES: CMD domain protein [unclassified Microbacterium]MCR2783597.1 CMD domain protein [Microbacterium sp. zg.B96]WIM15544.1 CMD domain protein [Microbacterium sp. zg-B96]
MSTAPPPDVVDAIVGIEPGSTLDALRRRRPVTRTETQTSFDALFAPRSADEVTLAERALVAAFVTRVTGDDDTAAFYRDRAAAIDPDRAGIVAAEASAAAASGPFGRYAEPGLQHENTEGLRYRADDAVRAELGERLATALEHAHLLVLRPREADAAALAALTEAGWSVDGIVTLSQLVAFLSLQQRVVAGLQTIAEEAAA